MGSDQTPISKHHRYDLSMSRRTRKSMNFDQDCYPVSEKNEDTSSPMEDYHEMKAGESSGSSNSDDGKRCLKQLIEGRNSLGQHLTKEENHDELELQVVVRQPEEYGNNNGLKLKKMVSRYAKVLGHMMKLKKGNTTLLGYRKKTILPLTK